MAGYFVWRVKGMHAGARAAALKAKTWTEQLAEDPTGSWSTMRVPLECLVLTHDPCGRDVPQLAIDMRIGGTAEDQERYDVEITSCECVGWASGKD